MFLKFILDERGTSAIEYALIAALISVAVIGGATAVGNSSTVQLENVSNHL